MDPELIQIIEAVIVIVSAVIAYIQNRLKGKAECETDQVIRYFDPTDDTVTEAPAVLPTRTYKMTNETKRWITFDHSPEEKECLLRQVAEAEAEGKDTYTLDYAGGYYEIEYGLLKGGAGCAKNSGAA